MKINYVGTYLIVSIIPSAPSCLSWNINNIYVNKDIRNVNYYKSNNFYSQLEN